MTIPTVSDPLISSNENLSLDISPSISILNGFANKLNGNASTSNSTSTSNESFSNFNPSKPMLNGNANEFIPNGFLKKPNGKMNELTSSNSNLDKFVSNGIMNTSLNELFINGSATESISNDTTDKSNSNAYTDESNINEALINESNNFHSSNKVSTLKLFGQSEIQIPSTKIIKVFGELFPKFVENIPDDMIRAALFTEIYYEKHSTAINRFKNRMLEDMNESSKTVFLTSIQKDILNSLKEDLVPINHLIKVNLYNNHYYCYLINAIELVNPNLNRPQIIIVLPTYELAEQVARTAFELTKDTGVKVKYLNKSNEYFLQDHILITSMFSFVYNIFKSLTINLKTTKQLIFDQVDLLVNSEKYLKNLKSIISKAQKAQIIFFSSTFSKLTDNILKREIAPISTLGIKFLDLTRASVLQNVLHFYVNCPSKQCRFWSLISVLNYTDQILVKKIVVFTIGTKSANHLFKRLIDKTPYRIFFVTIKINSNERIKIIDNFKNAKRAILIINYPLALNLDLKEVRFVINFDLPHKDKNGDKLTEAKLLEDNFFYSEYYHRLSILNSAKPCSVINLTSNNKFETMIKPGLEKHLGIHLYRIGMLFNSKYKKFNSNRRFKHQVKRYLFKYSPRFRITRPKRYIN